MSPHNSQHAVTPNSNTPPRIKFSGVRLSILPVLLLLSLLALSPLAAPGRADALTQDVDGVYLIATPADLREFRDRVNSEELISADARLTADIDLSTDGEPEEWISIGDGHKPTTVQSVGVPNYRGTFDGAGHTVGGYKITKLGSHANGFFGHIGVDGMVTGLTVSGNINIDMPGTTGHRAGGIAGQNVGTISNCVNYGAVASTVGDTGGIAGVNGSNPLTGMISNCVNRGNVTVTQAGGGIVGVNGYYSTTSNCVNDGDVYGSNSAENSGGIAGKNNGGKITNCVNYKTVSGSRYAGGVVGYTIFPTNTTSNCVNYGDVSSYPIDASQIAGGVVGWHEKGTLSNCVSVGGNVTNTKGDGTASAGGVVGTCGKEAKISNCGWLYSQENNKGVGSSDVTPAPEPVSLDQTEINESVVVALIADHMNITLRTGDTAKITLNALPGKQAAFGKYVKNITVPPDSEKISAKVNEEKGEITLTSLKEGTSALCVSADLYTTDFNNSLAPSVDPVPLSLTIYVSARRTLGGITLSPEKMNLRVGASGKFTATVTAEGAADQTINWHSSNEKIAAVDNEGNVKALAVGEATITAMTADGKHDAAAKVTVANRHSGGNGCAAGVGALALFALIPLLLRKKKS
ncbi:Ig-like domain-containing protein [Cloacibacillus porcorum]|uniref:BIG2 domain-containing protein n=1 Tax=Cloacibacillus porcorum TaxID=1197717 RepID=A0A1B2I4B6_9BACT|nr:Ig-like domain-containing protein [Cloacibacillus porcorum]ANZ44828.1 hypothetical protein BED41_06875 [Cloacibacillus porcorum]